MKTKKFFLNSLYTLLGFNFFALILYNFFRYSYSIQFEPGLLVFPGFINLIIFIIFLVALVEFVNEIDINFKRQKDTNKFLNENSWNNKLSISDFKKVDIASENDVKSDAEKNSASNIKLSEDTWTCSCGKVNENYCVRCTRCLKER